MGAVNEKTTRRNYPQRVDISEPGRGAVATPRTVRVDISPKGSAAYRAGRTVENVAGDAKRDALRATKNVATMFAPAAVAAASLLGSQGARVTARNFLDGLTGAPEGGFKVPVAPVALKAANPVAAAMTAGREAPPSPLTPQELMLAHLDTLLTRPMTQRGMQAVSGALQETTSNTPKVPSAKDTLLGATGQASQAIYADQIKDIIARKAAGELDGPAAVAAQTKATEGFVNRNSALLGNNLLSFAQANMLPQPDEEQ